MKKTNKKKEKQFTATGDTDTTTADAAVDAVDIKAIVHSHAAFMDKLVELIPARFYLPSNDDKPWFGGLSKKQKAKAKRQSLANIKKARRDRLDPEKSSKTTLDFLKESIEGGSKADSDGDDRDGGDDGGEEEGEGARSVTYEELQMKLHKKIEALRSGRGGASGGAGEGRKEKREARSRRRIEEGKWKGKEKDEVVVAAAEKKEKKRKKSEKDSVAKEVAEATKELEFGKVKLATPIDDATSFNKKNKKKKLSKEEELKKLLEMEEAKKDPEKGEIVKKQHAWKSATDKAMGVKVHDDPSRLRKSLHKEMKRQSKSKETWKKRLETAENMKKEKQNKRKTNIQAKVDLKKKAKIAKREKKLMRPGFEGRKEGFVTGK